jgi:integrase
MAIKYIDKTHAKLIVSLGSGKDRIRKTKNIIYKGKRDAERQYREFEDKVKEERTINTELTVENLLTWYITRFEMNGGKETTARAYKVAKKPIVAYFSNDKAKDLDLFRVEQFIASEAKIRAPKTIKNEMSLLSSAYKQAIRRRMLKTNPCEYAVIPKQVKKEVTILNANEIRRFVTALDTTIIDFKVMCELALFCGLRKSEILGLHSNDVSDTVTISKVRQHMNGEDVIQTPKTKTSYRTLAVPAFILDDIKKLQEEQATRPSSCEYLIRNKWGEAPGAAWCDKRMQELLENNDLPHITMHGLRHTYASMLIAEGVPVSEVSAQLGHASVDITLRVYTHLFTEATTASKAISDAINKKWAPQGHLSENEKAQSLENSGIYSGADERIRT